MGDDENGEEKEEEEWMEKDVAMMFDGEVRRRRGWGGRDSEAGWGVDRVGVGELGGPTTHHRPVVPRDSH